MSERDDLIEQAHHVVEVPRVNDVVVGASATVLRLPLEDGRNVTATIGSRSTALQLRRRTGYGSADTIVVPSNVDDMRILHRLIGKVINELERKAAG